MRVLAIKGGGVRGLLTACLGARLEKRLPGWSDELDLIAGTSTGAILALARAAGFSWKKIAALYRTCATKVFRPPTVPSELIERGAFYDTADLRTLLEKAFGELRLGDLKTDVFVPAISFVTVPGRADRPRPLFFTRQREGNLRVVDVLLAATAAPLYFPSHYGCIDGGLLANDPSLLALVSAAGGWSKLMLQGVMGELSVLTLGCGRTHAPRGMLEAISEGGLLGPIAGAIKLLGDAHHELEPELEEEIPLDGGEDLDGSLDELEVVAADVRLNGTTRWLRERGWAE